MIGFKALPLLSLSEVELKSHVDCTSDCRQFPVLTRVMHVFSLNSNWFSWSSLRSSSGSVIDSGSHLEKALIRVITMFDSRGVRQKGRHDGLVGDQSHLKCFT